MGRFCLKGRLRVPWSMLVSHYEHSREGIELSPLLMLVDRLPTEDLSLLTLFFSSAGSSLARPDDPWDDFRFCLKALF